MNDTDWPHIVCPQKHGWWARAYDRMMRLWERRRCKIYLFSLLVLFMVGILYFGYFCPEKVCALSVGSPTPQYKTQFEAYLEGHVLQEEFDEITLKKEYQFDIEEDVLVFLHMQKTGGTVFGRNLVKNMNLKVPCQCFKGKKRCDCHNSKRQIWLFSRYSTGWICGLHADWTELNTCVNDALDKREKAVRKRRYRYMYVTILRDPQQRYLSEWRHMSRGATWMAASLRCDGRQATLDEVPFCFEGPDWKSVTLEEFNDCPNNLAQNRQTRMLANLSLVGCYNRSAMPLETRQRMMLQSAKQNLQNMAFFGLTENQRDTQYLFEKTFHMKFIDDFVQFNTTHASDIHLSKEQHSKILELNKLDVELYQFAKDLFFQRLRLMREQDKLRTRGMHIGSTDQYALLKEHNRHTGINEQREELDENYADEYANENAESKRKFSTDYSKDSQR